MSSTLADRFEFVAGKLVYGGAALGYHAGRPVLVPYALPGERVRAETARIAKGMIHARPLEVLYPAPERVAAPCPYFGRCGGCHYQHLDAGRQLDVKRDILRETLRRVGRIDWTGEIGTHASEPWAYRNQVRLKIGTSGQIGFFAAESHDLISIETCPITSPRLNTVIHELARPGWSARLAGWGEVELRTDDRDERVVLTFHGGTRNPDEPTAGRLARDCMDSLPGVSGVAFEIAAIPAQRGSARTRPSHLRGSQDLAPEMRTFGEAALQYRVGTFEYRVSPGSFFQASRFLLPEFLASATGDLEIVSGRAIDLYAGAGLFTLPLARVFREVTAVEANDDAARDLAVNVRSHAAGSVRAVHSTAAEFLRRYAQGAPDLIVLDPPRAGAEAAMLGRLCAIGPQQVRYVSCHPPTLARDLAVLLHNGYAIERVDLFDLFPQTFHVETAVRMRKA